MILDILRQQLPKNELHPYFTYELGLLIYSFIVNSDVKTYLEIGSGYGAVMTIVGMAFKDTKRSYKLMGIEHHSSRVEYSKKLLTKYGLSSEIFLGDALKYDWEDPIDMIFIDCGHRNNQFLIDKYGSYVQKAFVLHDVTDKLIFPKNFNSIYLANCVIAFKFEQPKPFKGDICTPTL